MVKKKSSRPAAAAAGALKAPLVAETFDDFLNTLSDDDGDESEEEEEEGEGSSLDGDEEEQGGHGQLNGHNGEISDDDDDDEGGEEEEEDDDEDEVDMNENGVDSEEEDADGDDDSIDMEAELEKSLQGQVGDEEEEEPEEEEEDAEDGPEEEPDYFLRDEEPDDENADEEETASSFKKSLASLQQTDPDFFAYLKETDADLLNFEEGSDEDDSEDENEDEPSDEEDEEGAIHRLPTDLEVASDSEAESEEEQELDKESDEYKTKVATYLKKRIVNLSVISHWEEQLAKTRDLIVFAQVVEAFESAVETILQDKEKGASSARGSSTKWRVEGSTNFNGLMRLCIRSLFGWSVRFLGGTNNEEFASKAFTKAPYEVKKKNEGRWGKLRSKMRAYMIALVMFLKSMGNPEAITSVLRHCQTMSGFWALFTTKSYKLLRTLINIWSTGEDSARIAAFVTILRMSNYNKEFYLTRVFKQMYIAFVANCKFTSVNSWPAINFMRTSLVEIYLLDTKLAYQIAFPFVRQLAIHLRNATTAGGGPPGSGGGSGGAGDSKSGKIGGGGGKKNSSAGGTGDGMVGSKKEASRIVYSWQFLHSLHLWSHLLGDAGSKGDEHLQLLVYPVVQICLGTIKLIPTRKYIPLRFHIIKALIELQDKTKIFIPILPLITEVLHLTDFSYKTVAKFSVRPLNLQCCLKADANESGYHKAVADGIFDTLLGTCQVLATDLAFPEILTPTLIQLKAFLKTKCKNGEVARKFKTLVEKIEANGKFIKDKRATAMEKGLVSLADEKAQQILRLEMEGADPPPPILAFAKDYFKMNNKVKAKQLKIHTDETREERLIPKSSSGQLSKKKASKIEKVLFAEDDEDDEDEDGEEGGGGDGFENDSDDDEGEFKTKFDMDTDPQLEGEDDEEDEEEAVVLKKKGKRKNSNREEAKEVKAKKAKKKKKKGKAAAPAEEDADDDVQDEIVDLDFDSD